MVITEFDSGKEKGQYTRESGDSKRLVMGNSDNGGAGNVNWDHPDNSNDNIGFRAAVVLSSKVRLALQRTGLIFMRKRSLSSRQAFYLSLGVRTQVKETFYYQEFLSLYRVE